MPCLDSIIAYPSLHRPSALEPVFRHTFNVQWFQLGQKKSTKGVATAVFFGQFAGSGTKSPKRVRIPQIKLAGAGAILVSFLGS